MEVLLCIAVCVDIAWLLSNASDMRIKALGSPCAVAKWLTLHMKFVCCYKINSVEISRHGSSGKQVKC